MVKGCVKSSQTHAIFYLDNLDVGMLRISLWSKHYSHRVTDSKTLTLPSKAQKLRASATYLHLLIPLKTMIWTNKNVGKQSCSSKTTDI